MDYYHFQLRKLMAFCERENLIKRKMAQSQIVVPWAIFAIGILIVYHPMIFSWFSRIQPNPADPRFIHYLLEHSFQWMLQAKGHESLWSPPFFYPDVHSLAYSHTLFSLAPFYWVWRWPMGDPDTAFQLWMITMSCLNYGVFYYFVRRSLKLEPLAASAAAFLFSFGSPRIADMGHLHMLPQFYGVLSLIFLVKLYERKINPNSFDPRSLFYAGGFVAGIVGEFYAGFYHGWFLIFGLSVFLLIAIVNKWGRSQLIALGKSHYVGIVILGLAGFIVLSYLGMRYLHVAELVGYRSYEEVAQFLPAFVSWFFMGENNWAYGWLSRSLSHIQNIYPMGIGFATLGMVLYGFRMGWKTIWIRYVSGVTLALFIFTFDFPGSWEPWRIVYHGFPGARAIRAMSRISIVLLVPLSIALAIFFQSLKTKKRHKLLIACLILLILEQGRTMPSYDKKMVQADVDKIVERISPDCDAFLFTPVLTHHEYYQDAERYGVPPVFKYQIDAMWAQRKSGVPTINGFSGNTPPHWKLPMPIFNKNDEQTLGNNLSLWTRMNGIQRDRVCWIKMRGDLE